MNALTNKTKILTKKKYTAIYKKKKKKKVTLSKFYSVTKNFNKKRKIKGFSNHSQ